MVVDWPAEVQYRIRDVAREHLTRWARESLFAEFNAVLDGRYLEVTLRSSELVGQLDRPWSWGSSRRSRSTSWFVAQAPCMKTSERCRGP